MTDSAKVRVLEMWVEDPNGQIIIGGKAYRMTGKTVDPTPAQEAELVKQSLRLRLDEEMMDCYQFGTVPAPPGKPHCARCDKRLSRKSARLIGGRVLCSTCMFASDSGSLPKGENAAGG